jgi:hypothetical protein
MAERSDDSLHFGRGEACPPEVVQPRDGQRADARPALVLKLVDYARMLREPLDALRAVVAAKAKQSGFAQFDGHEFWKENRDWFVRIYEPWIRHARLRRWVSVEDAARILGVDPHTLRRRLQRHRRSEGGAWVARCKGLIACKFSRTWRVCLVGGPAARG